MESFEKLRNKYAILLKNIGSPRPPRLSHNPNLPKMEQQGPLSVLPMTVHLKCPLPIDRCTFIFKYFFRGCIGLWKNLCGLLFLCFIAFLWPNFWSLFWGGHEVPPSSPPVYYLPRFCCRTVTSWNRVGLILLVFDFGFGYFDGNGSTTIRLCRTKLQRNTTSALESIINERYYLKFMLIFSYWEGIRNYTVEATKCNHWYCYYLLVLSDSSWPKVIALRGFHTNIKRNRLTRYTKCL